MRTIAEACKRIIRNRDINFNNITLEQWKKIYMRDSNHRNIAPVTASEVKSRPRSYSDMYKTFKAETSNGDWVVRTVPDNIIIARIPYNIKHQKAVAQSLAKALSESRFALSDLL